MITDKEEVNGNWTNNLQLVFINDGSGFIIGNEGRVLTLRINQNNKNNKTLSWENSSEDNDGKIF